MNRLFGRISRRAWIISAIIVAVLALSAGGVYAYSQWVAPGLPQSAFGPPAATSGGQQRQGQRATRKNKPATARAGAGGGAAAQLLRLIASGIRGQVTVQDASAPGGFVVMSWAKGSLTSANTSTNQVTLREADGTSATFTVPSTARILVGGASGSLAALQPGTPIYVVSRQLQGGSPTVIAVVSQSATPASGAGGAGTNGLSTPTPTPTNT